MNRKKVQKKIRHRKAFLNILLLFMKRTNLIVVLVSQNLDYFIHCEQKIIYNTYSNNNKNILNKVA